MPDQVSSAIFCQSLSQTQPTNVLYASLSTNMMETTPALGDHYADVTTVTPAENSLKSLQNFKLNRICSGCKPMSKL